MGTRGVRGFWVKPLSFAVTERYDDEMKIGDYVNPKSITSSDWFQQLKEKYQKQDFEDAFFYCYVRIDDFIPFGTAQFDQNAKEPTIAVDSGMKDEWKNDPVWFTAVVVHELVHAVDARYGSEELSNMIYDEDAEAPIEDLPDGVEFGTPFDAEYFYKKTEMNAFQAQAGYLLESGQSPQNVKKQFEKHYLLNESYRGQFDLWFDCMMTRLNNNWWEV